MRDREVGENGMIIGLHNADNTNFPNLALMKLSAWHKSVGDDVSIYESLRHQTYNTVYSSKVFTFTNSEKPFGNVVWGGTGYGSPKNLPYDCEHIMPDYDIYNCDKSYGFLTRGCIRKCKHCVVPQKEGDIRANADIEEFLNHKECVLMDNNVLAHDHGIEQIEKIARLGIKVDFNQGLDARLIDDGIARRLSKVKWLSPIRLACDSKGQMKHIQRAVTLLRWHNTRPSKYFIYVIVNDIEDAFERVKFLKGMHLDPFVQPFIDCDNPQDPTDEQKYFSRWVNHKAVFNSVLWENYKGGQEC